MQLLTFGIAIPAYKNCDHLRRCLNSIFRVAPHAFKQITVCDDSGEGSVAKKLNSEFPDVRWIIHPINQGFGKSANDAVKANDCDIVILLNDDVELINNPVPFLQTAFVSPDLFAVTFKSLDETGVFREGAKRLVWPMGFPRILHNEADQLPAVQGIIPSSYAVGGHAAYRKDHFLQLNGFDALYDPFYWEDVDLCLRAHNHGWKTIYLPDCTVKHETHGAIRSHHQDTYIRQITLRNRILFAQRHRPPQLALLYAIGFAFRMFKSFFSNDHLFLKAWQLANAHKNK